MSGAARRIPSCFAGLAKVGRPGLIPYIVAGDPHPALTVPLMHRLVRHGADLIELGVPFSDPMADGRVIQHAHERALAHHTSLSRVLRMVSDFRRQDVTTPIVLMGYLNPLEAMGYQNFAAAAARAGVDGVLLVDLPPEEAEDCHALLRRHDLEEIFLVSPNTAVERVRLIATLSGSYVYCVSLKGVTGSTALDIPAVLAQLKALRRLTRLPLAVGFGIQSGAVAAALAKQCDAVVIGSALVDCIARHPSDEAAMFSALAEFLSGIRRALDQGSEAA